MQTEAAFATLPVSHTFDDAVAEGGAFDASHLLFLWERRTVGGLSYAADVNLSGRAFDPGVGFIDRRDYSSLVGDLQYLPCAPSPYGVRREAFAATPTARWSRASSLPGWVPSSRTVAPWASTIAPTTRACEAASPSPRASTCRRGSTGSTTESWPTGGARRGSVWSSPIAVDDRVYLIDRSGVMQVLALADEFELLGVSQIGEGAYATPAFVGDRIYIRGLTHLFCIAPTAVPTR
jgi:hypothetical protein